MEVSVIKYFKFLYSIIILFSIFIIIFFSSTLSESTSANTSNNLTVYSSSTITSTSNYVWPIPGITRISSYFGKRKSPTAFASSFHKGIDIPASPGTNIFASMSGTVVTAGFSGSGGCTVTIKKDNILISYCHVSPNFIVTPGQYVEKGQLIAQVGPKNVYGFANNKYRDSNGNPTNGATTGPHLHLAIKENNVYKNPLDYFDDF
ncbi:MAG: M23 family metallopeptidase [Clostridia bacterium]|nr:M23 family metallopeptidase [Clostridia bacterium]